MDFPFERTWLGHSKFDKASNTLIIRPKLNSSENHIKEGLFFSARKREHDVDTVLVV